MILQSLCISSSVSNSNLPRFRCLGSCSGSSSSLLGRCGSGSGVSFCSRSRRWSSQWAIKGRHPLIRQKGLRLRRRLYRVVAMDEDVGVSSLDDPIGGDVVYAFSSSEGEESDGDIILQPITDVDLPITSEHYHPADDSITVTTHRFATLGQSQRKRKMKSGIINNVGLIAFVTVLLLLVDWCAWRIVRLPLQPFHLLRPFFISAVIVSCVGYICIPLLRIFKIQSVSRREGLAGYSSKKGTPTMGGLYFVPIGVLVAEVLVGFKSTEVLGASIATLAFSAIGLVDDVMNLRNNKGLSAWIRVFLEVAAGSLFSCWLCTVDVPSPYSMKMVVPLPAPVGLVCLGGFFPYLTSFCFVSMANGINLTNGLDGLAGGTAAMALIAMSIAALPICPDLAIFGASMAGACVGFLLHNRYKASIFMGDTGALALGGALAAMAACTGMFFPLLISSSIFLIEILWFLLQVPFFKTPGLQGTSYHLFQMVPFHQHLELSGIEEPIIVGGAYIISSMLVLCAGYVGLISA